MFYLTSHDNKTFNIKRCVVMPTKDNFISNASLTTVNDFCAVVYVNPKNKIAGYSIKLVEG